jgi:hypothetical protein
MEALLERGTDVENWNDERMDELSRRVDAGFEKTATKEEMNRRFGEVNERFDRFERAVGSRFDEVAGELRHLSERFDRLLNTLTVGLIGVVAALLAGGIFG